MSLKIQKSLTLLVRSGPAVNGADSGAVPGTQDCLKALLSSLHSGYVFLINLLTPLIVNIIKCAIHGLNWNGLSL